MSAKPEASSKPDSAKILVFEDQYLLASHLARILQNAGFTVIGPVSRVSDGLRLINACDGQLDAAILDVDLASEPADAIAEELGRRGVAFIFATTRGRYGIPTRFADRPFVGKPFDSSNLRRVLSSVISRRRQEDPIGNGQRATAGRAP
jgi:DNA-binding response OmpR family regulator